MMPGWPQKITWRRNSKTANARLLNDNTRDTVPVLGMDPV